MKLLSKYFIYIRILSVRMTTFGESPKENPLNSGERDTHAFSSTSFFSPYMKKLTVCVRTVDIESAPSEKEETRMVRGLGLK